MVAKFHTSPRKSGHPNSSNGYELRIAKTIFKAVERFMKSTLWHSSARFCSLSLVLQLTKAMALVVFLGMTKKEAAETGDISVLVSDSLPESLSIAENALT